MRIAGGNTRGEKRRCGPLAAIVIALAALATRPAAAQFTGPIVLQATSGAATDTLPMVVDLVGPTVTVTSPTLGSVIAGTTVTVTGTVTDAEDGTGLGAPRPVFSQVRWQAVDLNLSVLIAQGSVPLVSGRFTIPDIPLGTGTFQIGVVADDAAGNLGTGIADVTTDPNAPPIAVVSPPPGFATLDSSTPVDLNFSAPTTLVSVNGVPDGRVFPAGFVEAALTVPLQVGPNLVSLVFDSGTGPHSFDFTLFRVAAIDPIRISVPADGTLTNKSPVAVTVIAPLGTPFVQVNGIAATAAPDGTTFTAQVPLQEGANNLFALAAPFGQQATAHVTLDTKPPQITLASPPAGASVDPSVLVAGTVTKNAVVTVSGPGGTSVAQLRFDATLSNPFIGSDVFEFQVPTFPLVAGSNKITVQATDPAGNVSTTSVTVVQQSSALELISPANGSTLGTTQTDVTLQVLADSVIDAVYVAGLQLPSFNGITLAAGTATLPGLPLVPGTDDVRIVSHRVSGTGQEVLDFTLISTATNVATVTGSVTDAASGQPINGALVTVTQNGTPVVVVTNPDGSFATPVTPGAVTVAATAPGNSATSVSATVPAAGGTATANLALPSAGISALPNQLAIVVPPPNTVTDWSLITVVGTVENPASSVSVNGIAAQLVGNRFIAQHVPLSMGANTLTVTATASGVATVTATESVQRSDTPVVAVKLFSPPGNVTIPGGGLVVRGWVSASDALVTLNESAPTAAQEGIFLFTDVFLPLGTASLQVSVNRSGAPGVTAADSIPVQVADQHAALILSASPTSGIAPFVSQLQLSSGGQPFQIARVDFDLNGDGTLAIIGSPTFQATENMATPRTILARAFVTTNDGVELSAPVRISAYLPAVPLQQFAAGNPVALAPSPAGGLFVLDAGGHVAEYGSDGSLRQQFGSSGSGPSQLNGPQAIAVDGLGQVYVADTGNNRVQVFSSSGQFVRTFGSSGSAAGQLQGPRGIAIDGDSIVVVDTGNQRLQRFDGNGGSLGTVPLQDGRGAAATSRWGVLVASPSQGLLSLVGSQRQVPEPLAGLAADGQLQAPIDVAQGPDGILVADASVSQVGVFSQQLRLLRLVSGLARPPLAVLPSPRREMQSFFVADGTSVQEIGLPTPSPIPVLQALKSALSAGDVNGALQLIHPFARSRFQTIYQRILPDLPLDAGEMTGFDIDLLREDRAIAVILRTQVKNGASVQRRFPVYLVRAPDGSWLILDY
jgi:hypothetical protein